MRLLDTYALATGSTIDKPFIFESYFPLPFEKYVTFQAQTKYGSKDYDYWQDVITMVYPILEQRGIKIVQVGVPSEFQYQYAIDLRGRTDMNQLAYIIKNATLHIGSDSFGKHLAAGYDVPLVALYSVSQSTVSGPHFGSKDKQIVFDAYLRTKTGKPSYASQEHPKCINLIKPEEIANAIFKLLNIETRVPFETVTMGDKYCQKIIRELIPNQVINVENPNNPVEIRMDVDFNEQVLAQQLSLCKSVVVTDKPINKDILAHFKPNILALVYEIKEQNDPTFLDQIKHLGISTILITYLPPEKIQENKIKYYEHGGINSIPQPSEEQVSNLKKDINSLYFRSNKIVCSKGKLFMGNAARIADMEITSDFEYQKVPDLPEFWQELSFMTVVKKL